MEFKQLLFFSTIVEIGNMTRAAEELMVSQPFLSKTISALEDELGATLFDRVKNRIVLNERGQAFYRRVQKIFKEMDGAKEEIDEMMSKSSNSIIVVTNVSLYMPDLLYEFHIKHPEITINQRSAKRQNMLKMLENRKADYAILTPPLEKSNDSPFISRPILNEELFFVFSEGHKFGNMKNVCSTDLVNEHFITAIKGYGIRDYADIFFEKINLSPFIIVESTETSLLPDYIKKGLGIGLLPRSFSEADPVLCNNSVRLKDIKLESTVEIVQLEDRYRNEPKKIFESFVYEHFLKIQENIYGVGDII